MRSRMMLGVALLLVLVPGGPATAERVTGSGRVIDETRPVGEFTRIAASAGIQVRVEAGANAGIALRGEDNLLPHVRTEVRRGTLHIDLEPDLSMGTHEPIYVALRAARLDGVSVSGGSRVESLAPAGDALELESSGGGTIHLAITARVNRLQISASGGSNVTIDGVNAEKASVGSSGAAMVTLAGRATALNLHISGASELRAAKLEVGELAVEGSGGSRASVHAGRARGSLSGGARLRVGSDTEADVKVSGGAELQRRL